MNTEYFIRDQSKERDSIESVEQARELQLLRWEALTEIGIVADIESIVRALGHDPCSIDDEGNKQYYRSAYGPKRRLRIDSEGAVTLIKAESVVTVFWDGYGGYTTVTDNGSPVYSSHSCSRFVIPGEWLELVLSLKDQAIEVDLKNAASKQSEDLKTALNYL